MYQWIVMPVLAALLLSALISPWSSSKIDNSVEIVHFGDDIHTIVSNSSRLYVLLLPPDENELTMDENVVRLDSRTIRSGVVLSSNHTALYAGAMFQSGVSCDWQHTNETICLDSVAIRDKRIAANSEVLLMRRTLFLELDGLNTALDSYQDMYIDVCLRAAKYGVKIVVDPNLRLVSHRSQIECKLIKADLSTDYIHPIPVLYSALLGPYYSDTGFFHEGTALLKILMSARFSVAVDQNCMGWELHPSRCETEWQGSPSEEIKRIITSLAMRKKCVPNRPIIMIRHLPVDWFDAKRIDTYNNPDSIALPNDYFVFGGKYYVEGSDKQMHRVFRVARTMYETDGIPERWAQKLNQYDEVWVPSFLGRRVLVSSGVDPLRIRVIPEPLDLSEWRFQDESTLILPNTRSFVFLSVLKWEDRKGWDVLLKSYFDEFSDDDDVSLVIRATYLDRYHIGNTKEFLIGQLASKGINVTKKMADLPHVVLMPHALSESEILGLNVAATVFVCPTRGEGWGLNFHQAMALGKAVIATGWGGHLEFMNERNSFLVNYEMKQSGQQYGNWAEPSYSHLRYLMRFAAENPSVCEVWR